MADVNYGETIKGVRIGTGTILIWPVLQLMQA
jgi:hypothetical protein